MKKKTPEKVLQWYQAETLRDDLEVKKSKEDFISSLKNIDKSEIKNTVVETKSYSLWERIKRVLTIG
jgi:hypothetical protein